ncbi:asparaginase [Gynuella sp.]|uniref:asparaginase n=1 Tax=Gynuella sp. TaxID=2969146 RepID=UPI003D0FF44A
MKRRILILHTGGTIGMQNSPQGYVPATGFADLVALQLQARAVEELPAYDLVEFEQLIDSSNLNPSDWMQIGRRITEHWQDYDGFIVLHGTDTMAYTASALSFILQGANKPVIVTGSQIPLTELRNDALDNLVTSMILAADERISEVCIYFNGRLLRGNRSTKVRSVGFDAFDSPNLDWLGEIGIHIQLRQNLLLPAGQPHFELPEFSAGAVVVAPMYPGIQARVIRDLIDHDDVRALIIQSYGVGNPPDGNRALIDELARAGEQGIVVVNISQCLQGGVYQGAYATGSALNQIGVVAGADLTLEAAFTKLHHLVAMGSDADSIRHLFAEALCGECTVN